MEISRGIACSCRIPHRLGLTLRVDSLKTQIFYSFLFKKKKNWQDVLLKAEAIGFYFSFEMTQRM